MIQKRLLFLPAITLALYLGIFNIASAHVLKTDGSIGAIMHIDPDDDPIAGSPATFFFELKDKDGKFKGADCNCQVAIVQNGQQLYTAPLFQAGQTVDINTPVFSFTFPEEAVYQVVFTGKPITAGEFQTFTLNYDVRVDRQVAPASAANPSAPPSDGHLFHYILFGGGFLAILFLYLNEKRKSKSKDKKNKPSRPLPLVMVAGAMLVAFSVHGSMLDCALCFADHPVMQDHQCCVAPAATLVMPVSVHTQSAVVALQPLDLNFIKEFTLVVNNKSPPL